MKIIKNWWMNLCSIWLGMFAFAAVEAQATVPAYVTTALTNAQTTLTEYIEAAAPFLFAVTILVAAIFLIVRFIKRAAS